MFLGHTLSKAKLPAIQDAAAISCILVSCHNTDPEPNGIKAVTVKLSQYENNEDIFIPKISLIKLSTPFHWK